MNSNFGLSASAWAEAFTIFAKYTGDFCPIAAEHDIIYAGPDIDKVSEADKNRLIELGWRIDEDTESFARFV